MNSFTHYDNAKHDGGTYFRDGQALSAADLLNESRSLLWHAAYFSSAGQVQPHGLLASAGVDCSKWTREDSKVQVPEGAVFRLRNGVVIRITSQLTQMTTKDEPNAWLIVKPAVANGKAEIARLEPKLQVGKSLNEDDKEGDWYTEIVPLALAQFGGRKGPANEMCTKLQKSTRDLVKALKNWALSDQSKAVVALGAAAAAEFLAQRVDDPRFDVFELRQVVTQINAWLALARPDLLIDAEFPVDKDVNENILEDVAKAWGSVCKGIAPQEVWQTQSLDEFIARLGLGTVPYADRQWKLLEPKIGKEIEVRVPPADEDNVFLVVSMEALNLQVTPKGGGSVLTPRSDDKETQDSFHIVLGTSSWLGLNEAFVLHAETGFACLIAER